MPISTSSAASDGDIDDVRVGIELLGVATREVRKYGFLTVGLTMATICFAVLMSLFVNSFGDRIGIAALAASALAALGTLALFEMRRKEGNAIFEEISDDLQWRVAQSRSEVLTAGKSEPSPVAREKPGFEARLALRKFTQASDLPLVPGAKGPAVYAMLNLGFVVLGAFLSRFVHFS